MSASRHKVLSAYGLKDLSAYRHKVLLICRHKVLPACRKIKVKRSLLMKVKICQINAHSFNLYKLELQFQQTALTQFQPIDLEQNPLANNDINALFIVFVFMSSERSWKACRHILFGSFHQNDRRFSEDARGFQCTGNALCMLSYSAGLQIDNSSTLDKILCDGDALYQTIINNMKADGKFIHLLDEVPDVFEVEIGKFIVENNLL